MPNSVEVALLRGGLAAVMETVLFDLYVRKMIELKTGGSDRKLLAVVIPEQRTHISELEESVILAFTAVQGKFFLVKKSRQQLTVCLRRTEENMQKAGWWKTPARWHQLLPILAASLIVGGGLRFFDYYEGTEKWILALTVPVWAVIGRRIVYGELSGPTSRGKQLLDQLRREVYRAADPVWLLGLQGIEYLAAQPEYRLFYFMMRGIPFRHI